MSENTKNMNQHKINQFQSKVEKFLSEHRVGSGAKFTHVSMGSSFIGKFLLDKENCKKFNLQLPDSFLTPNTYYFSVGVHIPNIQVIDEKEKVGNLTIYDNGSEFFKYPIGEYGVVFANSKWIY